MLRKIHVVTIFVLFVLTNICSGYLYDYKPELINPDYRLAAMGGLDLVTEYWDNEINAYDFGESPAGIISDNQGKSNVYLPLSYGKTQFGDTTHFSWDGYGLSALCVAKFGSRCAIGVDLTKARGNTRETYDFSGGGNHYDIYDGLFNGAYTFSRSVVAGFRFNYSKSKFIYTYYDSIDEYTGDYETDMYEYAPALLIRPVKSHWQFGFNYRLRKYRATPSIHDFVLPVIFASRRLSFAGKAGFGTDPFDGDERKYFNSRLLYRIHHGNGTVNIGLILNVEDPIVHEGIGLSSSPGSQLDLGMGIAYVNEQFGLVGLQYVHKTMFNDSIYWHGASTEHESYIHLGTEVRFFKGVPIRCGYKNVSYDYPYLTFYAPALNIITAGFGIEIEESQIAIDFAYNLVFLDYIYYDPYSNLRIDRDHLFGLSGRFFW